jgi:hypothetical protein
MFKSELGYFTALKKNSLCRSCAKMGRNNPSFGVFPSSSIRKKISDFHLGKPKSESHKKKISDTRISFGLAKGENNPFYGKHHTEDTKKKLSDLQVGPKSYKYHKPVSDETKSKMRNAILRRMERNGVAPCVDVGSDKFFEKVNGVGFNFKPKRFLDIGYYADGYCDKSHIWVEFDTPHHNQLYKIKADTIRQNNIIKHFEKINNPLKGFLRVQSDKIGNVIGSKCIYKGGH